MKKYFSEFKTFITRGNVLDMSVGVIVGGAFTAIVNGLSNNILRPLINWLLAVILGTDSLSGIHTILLPAYTAEGAIDLTQSIYIDWGAFVNAIINFLLIAIVLFTIVRVINSISQSHEEAKKEMKLQREAVKKYKKEGLSKKDAIARYTAELEAEKAKKEAEEKAAAEAAQNEEKEMDVLKDIRDLLVAKSKNADEASENN